MAKFIEYKSNPSWTTLFRCCWGGVIPLLAVILFIQGVVSTIGLVVIVACLIGVLFFLNEQVKRRSGIVTEVASGKLPKGPSKTVDHTVLEFREDRFGRTAMGIVSCIMVLIVTTTYKTKGAWAAVGPVLVASAILLLYLAVLWASSMRLRIEGDEVQVIYPPWDDGGTGLFASAKSPRSRCGSSMAARRFVSCYTTAVPSAI